MTKPLKIATLLLMACLLVSCRTYHSRSSTETVGQLVHITVSGEVKRQGAVVITRDFTKASFLDAVGGFTYGSNMAATPTHFRLKRHDGQKIREWKIRFDEMPALKAKGFTFEDGDVIEVPRLLF